MGTVGDVADVSRIFANTNAAAAGGAITNLDNKELTYGRKNFQQGGIIIASMDKKIHENLCNQIKETIKKFNLYPL